MLSLSEGSWISPCCTCTCRFRAKQKPRIFSCCAHSDRPRLCMATLNTQPVNRTTSKIANTKPPHRNSSGCGCASRDRRVAAVRGSCRVLFLLFLSFPLQKNRGCGRICKDHFIIILELKLFLYLCLEQYAYMLSNNDTRDHRHVQVIM